MGKIILEKEILNFCKHKLDIWIMKKVVLRYERINCGRVKTKFGHWFYGAKSGFPDLFVEVKMGNIIHICYFETKKPNNSIKRKSQLLFKKQHEGFNNISYDFIDNPEGIDTRIESLTGYHANQLERMNL